MAAILYWPQCVNTKQGTGNHLNLWRLYWHVCHFLPVISQGSQPCLGYVNILHTCEAVDCLVAAWSLAKEFKFLATTKQLYEWSCPSFRHTHLSSGAIDTDRGNVHAKDQGQKSRSQRSKQILPQFEHVRAVTPVWIHIWLPNDAQSLKWHRKCALLFFKVICEISRSRKANLRDLIAATGLVIFLKFYSNHRFFGLCDLEIWCMTLKNNGASLLYNIKFCASFQSHRWIQTVLLSRNAQIHRGA